MTEIETKCSLFDTMILGIFAQIIFSGETVFFSFQLWIGLF